jgi:hypothetical protein
MARTVRAEAPLTAQWATHLWLLAVGAGAAETVVHVADALGEDVALSSLAGQIAVRAIIYGALFVVIDRYFRRGVPWSRYLLAGLLGTVGVASLVFEPIAWFVDDGDFTTLDWSPGLVAIALIRSVHLTAVLTALALTVHRDTTRWFRAVKQQKAGPPLEDRPSERAVTDPSASGRGRRSERR